MFVTPDFTELKQAIEAAGPVDVERALASERIGTKGLAALLSPAAEPYLGLMAEKSAQITGRRFGRAIQLYAPLVV